MCGFLGEYIYNPTNLLSSGKFEKLLLLSKYRGPDNTAVLKQNNYQLGFNRLAILDISNAGNQPMESLSGKYHIVFNGEIYNYKELITNYNLSNLKSTSDSEVISRLLDKIGVKKTITVLNGMFAIAIVDTKLKQLFLARDFAGIKPLFYGINKEGVVFASQFNQIFKHSLFESNLKLRPEIMKEYFGLGYMQAPNTIYENMYQVLPGELIQINLKEELKKTIICDFSKVNIANPSSKSYLSVLKNVIKRQLVSDVPLATFISGGIDSPLISAVAKELQPNIKGYTIGVANKKIDESKKASEYGTALNLNHTIENISETDILENIDKHFNYIPEPFGDYSSIPTYLITKITSKNQKVMLSGDGGDELFFGYPRMLDVLNHKWLFKIPFSIRKPIVKVLYKLKLVNSMGSFYYKNIKDWVLAKQLHIFSDKLDQMFPKCEFSNELLNYYTVDNKKDSKSLLHWLRWNEFYTHLQRVLVKVDRTSMGNSLEVRVPFLDKESIEFAWKLKVPSLKRNNDLKKELKISLAKFIPKKIIEEKKKGFSVPMYTWLHNELKEDVIKLVFNTPFYGEDFINVEEVKKYVYDFYSKEHSSEWGVWHIYAWQKWAVTHVLN